MVHWDLFLLALCMRYYLSSGVDNTRTGQHHALQENIAGATGHSVMTCNRLSSRGEGFSLRRTGRAAGATVLPSREVQVVCLETWKIQAAFGLLHFGCKCPGGLVGGILGLFRAGVGCRGSFEGIGSRCV